jgi:serine/threonine-protein kinase
LDAIEELANKNQKILYPYRLGQLVLFSFSGIPAQMKYPSKSSTLATVLALSVALLQAIHPGIASAEELTAEQYYKRGSQGIVDGQNAAAVEDFNQALQKDPQYWKAYGARSAARYNCGDYQGALKDIDIAIAHLPPKQSLITHKELCKKALANQSVQSQNQEARLMAQQMLLNAQLGTGFGMQGNLILMAARKRAGLNPLTGLPLGTSLTPATGASRARDTDPNSPSSVSSRLEAMNPGANLPPVKVQPHETAKQPSTSSAYIQTVAPEQVQHSISAKTQSSASMNSLSLSPLNNQAVASAAVPAETTTKAQEVTPSDTKNENMTAQQYFDRACGKGHASDFAGALKDYDEAIHLNPQHGPAYANRGSIRFNTGDHKGALEDFNKAVLLMPDNQGVKDLRAIVIKAIGQ